MRLLRAVLLLFICLPLARAQLPPKRSTMYNGTGVTMQYPAEVWAPNLSMTVEAWVYREDPARCETIVSQNFTSSFWFGFCGNSLRFYRNGGNFVDADRNVSARRWTHVAAVYDGASQQVRFYIDGALVSTKARAATFSAINAPLHVAMTPAGFIGGSTYPFHGAIDNLRIWSTARTGAEINNSRFVEITSSAAGLVASFPNGGELEVTRPLSPTSKAGYALQTFGVLPRNLVIPRRPTFDSVDGDITFAEYDGAEMMPLRYMEGTNEVDTAVLLNAYVGSSTYVYAALFDLKPIGDVGFEDRASFNWFFGVADQAVPDFNEQKATSYYDTRANIFRRGDGAGFGTVDPSPSTIIGKKFCAGDVWPVCIEMRSQVPTVSPRAMMFEFFWPAKISIADEHFYSPFNAVPNNPQTWPTWSLGSVVGSAETVHLTAHVEQFLGGPSDTRVVGTAVRLRNALSLDELAIGTTGPEGHVTLTATIRTGTPLMLELAAPDYWPRLGTRVWPVSGVNPVSMGSGFARWDGCAGCDFADIIFTTRAIPEGESIVTSFTPATGHFKRTVIRDTPELILPASEITLHGTNLHMSSEVYLTTCDCNVFSDTSSTPEAATGCSASSFHRVQHISVSADHSSMVVWLDSTTVSVGANYRVLFRDIPNRDGRQQWRYLPGTIRFGEPPYPIVHGFSFFNERDGTQFDEFSGVFQWNAYDCLIPPGIVIPPVQTCPGCRIPNPVYFTYYALFTGWVEAMTGSCLGMSATSLMFARGDLDTESFAGGVHYANGFRGRGTLFDEAPKPQEHRFRFCDYSEPVNLWAHIHRNQAVQPTAQFLTSVLSQMSGTGIGTTSYSIAGSPNEALSRIRSNLRGSLLCFQDGADVFKSHCVVPYAVIDGKSLADDGFTLVDRAESTIIAVYDSNWANWNNRYFEIKRDVNEYRYMFTRRDIDGVRTPIFWSGKGMYATPISIWHQPRTMPGFDLLERGLTLLLFGSADGLYRDSTGGEWGWNPAGNFLGTYEGARAFAPATDVNDVANATRSIFFFPPTNRPPTSIKVNVRGKDWKFHASEAGTLCMILASNAVPNDVDGLNLTLQGAALRGFRFSPQRATSSFEPILGLNLDTNPAVVFSWQGILIGDGKSGEFVAKHEKSGVEFLNDTGAESRPTLRVLRGDGDGFKTNTFGPFTVPLGATQLAAVADPNDADTIRVELDTDRDGTPESIAYVSPATKEPPPAPTLLAENSEKDGVLVSWPVNGGAWTLEVTETLGDTAFWKTEPSQPVLISGRATVTLSSPTGQKFLRLRAAF